MCVNHVQHRAAHLGELDRFLHRDRGGVGPVGPDDDGLVHGLLLLPNSDGCVRSDWFGAHAAPMMASAGQLQPLAALSIAWKSCRRAAASFAFFFGSVIPLTPRPRW